MNREEAPLTLGTEGIWNLLLQYALPSVVAMTASSLYNITDSIFIGQGLGSMAISGLAITFPLMNLAAAVGSMVGMGASTLMSLRLGQKDYHTANNILGNVLTMNIIFGISYTVIVLTFLDPILYFFGASGDTINYARDYMQIITLGNVVTHMYLGLNALLRASGYPKIAMYATISSVIINATLTPVFIYGLHWGIRGAATATIMAQAAMMVFQIRHFSNRNNFIHFQQGMFRLKRHIVSGSLSIGLAPFLMNAVSSVIVLLINQGLLRHGGDLSVGAYGIVNRVAFLFLMVVMGLNMGMQPIAGYNFGAGHIDRVNRVLKLTILLATGVMTTGFIISELIPRTVASVFTHDQELIGRVVTGLRIVMMLFPVVGFQMVTSHFFMSIGMAGKAIFMSLTRQLIFLLPCLLILPSYLGVKGVWYSMPVADLFSVILAVYLLTVVYRKSVIKH